jgi:CHASE3 domain sensor protein
MLKIKTGTIPGGWLLSAIIVVLLLVAVAVPWWLVQSVRSARVAVGHTHDVITTTQQFLSALQDAETGQRGYLITGEESYREPYDAALARIQDHLRQLSNLSSDDPAQVERIGRLSVFTEQHLAELARSFDLIRQGRTPAEAIGNDRAKIAMDNARAVVAEIEAAETVKRTQLVAETRRAETVTVLGMVAVLMALVAVLATAAILIRQLLAATGAAEQRAAVNA